MRDGLYKNLTLCKSINISCFDHGPFILFSSLVYLVSLMTALSGQKFVEAIEYHRFIDGVLLVVFSIAPIIM